MNAKFMFIACIAIVFIIGVALAASPGFNKLGKNVKMILAFHIGASKSDDGIVSNDNFVSAEDGLVVALVGSGERFGSDSNSVYSANDYSIELKQAASNNRFLLVFTNGTNKTISDKIDGLVDRKIVGTRFGSGLVTMPSSFRIFLRLQYDNIDFVNRLKLVTGVREIVVRNSGENAAGNPEIFFELMG